MISVPYGRADQPASRPPSLVKFTLAGNALLPAFLIFALYSNTMTYEELIKKHPGSLVEKIVTEVVNKDTIDVHFESEDDDQWSVIKIHIYEEDKEMALRCLGPGNWVLQFGYYDDNDEFIELLQPLTEDQINLVPTRLQKVLLKVLADEKGMRLPGNFLSR